MCLLFSCAALLPGGMYNASGFMLLHRGLAYCCLANPIFTITPLYCVQQSGKIILSIVAKGDGLRYAV